MSPNSEETKQAEIRNDENIVDNADYRQTAAYSSDTDESSDDDAYFLKMHENAPVKEGSVVKTPKVPQEDLPPVENIDINENVDNLRKIGHIQHSIIDPERNQFLVIVIADEGSDPLDEDSVLFSATGESLGKIHETYMKVTRPSYSIRFNNADEISAKNFTNGQPVYYSPGNEEVTRFVLVNELRKQKGSDASWRDNAEPPPDQIDFSDDEQEKIAKKGGKFPNKQREPNSDVEEVTLRKLEKSKAPAANNRPRGFFPRRLQPASAPRPAPKRRYQETRTGSSPNQRFPGPNRSSPPSSWNVPPNRNGFYRFNSTPPPNSVPPHSPLASGSASPCTEVPDPYCFSSRDFSSSYSLASEFLYIIPPPRTPPPPCVPESISTVDGCMIIKSPPPSQFSAYGSTPPQTSTAPSPRNVPRSISQVQGRIIPNSAPPFDYSIYGRSNPPQNHSHRLPARPVSPCASNQAGFPDATHNVGGFVYGTTPPQAQVPPSFALQPMPPHAGNQNSFHVASHNINTLPQAQLQPVFPPPVAGNQNFFGGATHNVNSIPNIHNSFVHGSFQSGAINVPLAVQRTMAPLQYMPGPQMQFHPPAPNATPPPLPNQFVGNSAPPSQVFALQYPAYYNHH